MPEAVLIDTDMGVDDAVAITLALNAPAMQLVGVVSVAGNVSLDQATENTGRLLGALCPKALPMIGRGLDQKADALEDATHVFGSDGLGGLELAAPKSFAPKGYVEVYEELVAAHGKSLTVVAIGPLTNLAALQQDRPELLEQAGRIVVMGGAVWCPGNVTPHAEFNFYRDPKAAEAVLSAGLPVTVVPLDVTRQVAMDESHLAHLSCSGSRSGELLARMIRHPIELETEGAGAGTFLVHDALAVGFLVWPELFIRSKMALSITTAGEQAGRCKPKVAKDKSRQLGVVMSVNVGEFLGNLVESLCQEKFVV